MLEARRHCEACVRGKVQAIVGTVSVTFVLVAAVLLGVFILIPGGARATSWGIEVPDNDWGAGFFTSLALDSYGNPHIAYHFNGAAPRLPTLYYVSRVGGSWGSPEQVDPSPHQTGWAISLRIDQNNVPHISYQDVSIGYLMYVKTTGGIWDVPQQVKPVGSSGSVYTSIDVDGGNNPHIAYRRSDTDNLNYIQNNGGSWGQQETPDASTGAGWYVSLRLDSSGNPHVAYYHNSLRTLRYVEKVGNSWGAPETPDTSGNDVGRYASLTLDNGGDPRIAYFDNTLGALKYIEKTGATWGTPETPVSSGTVSGFTSLALDGVGNPHISYYSSTKVLKYIVKTGVIWGAPETVDSPGDVGYDNSLALDGNGCAHISYHDLTNNILKYATCNKPPTTPSIPSGPSIGNKEAAYTYSTVATDPEGDQIRYTFNWGDGTQSVTGYYPSGQTATMSHTWHKPGTYCVKTMATDIHGAPSGWSDCLYVTILHSLLPDAGTEWSYYGDSTVKAVFAAELDNPPDNNVEIITVGEAITGPPPVKQAAVIVWREVGQSLIPVGSFYWAPQNGEASFDGVYAEDINDDGIVEIMVVGWAGSVTVHDPLLCNATWSGNNIQMGCYTQALAGEMHSVHAADLTASHPGKEVVAVGQCFNGITYQSYMLLGWFSGGSFLAYDSATWTFGNESVAYSVYAADVNADGRPEVMTAGYTRALQTPYKWAQLRMWSHIDGVGFVLDDEKKRNDMGGGAEAYSVFARDVDNDPVPIVEIMVCGYASDGYIDWGQLVVYHATSSLQFATSTMWQNISNRCNSVYAADLDGDPVSLEIATGGWSTQSDGNYGELRIWHLTGGGLSQLAVAEWNKFTTGAPSSMVEVNSVFAGEVDNDGINEVVSGGQIWYGSPYNAWGCQLKVWHDP